MKIDYTVGIWSLRDWRPLFDPPRIYDDPVECAQACFDARAQMQRACDVPFEYAVLRWAGGRWHLFCES